MIRLTQQGFIAYMDEDKKELALLNSGVGHIKSDENFKAQGYIRMHHFFFSKMFFDLPLPCKKIALILASRFDGSATSSVKLNFKSKKNPEMFVYWKKILKVNRLAHIKTAINKLKVFFSAIELSNNTFEFNLNTLSLPLITGADKFFRFTQAQLKQTETIVKESVKEGVSFRQKDIQEICEATCGYNMYIRRRTIKELCKYNRSHVKNLLGYTKSVMKRVMEEIANKRGLNRYQNC